MPMMSPSRGNGPGEQARAHSALARDLAAYAAPLAAFFAMASFAGLETDPVASVEGAFLARVAVGVLLAVAALAPPPAIELAVGCVLATAAVWGLPAGPSRGAVVAMILAGCLAAAGVRRLSLILPALPFAAVLPLAVGLQILVRGNLLLVPVLEVRPLVVLLGLPIVAAAALALLAWRHGGERALLAGAAAAMLGPGWTAASTAALVTLAAGSALAVLWPARDPRKADPVRPRAGNPRPGAEAREDDGQEASATSSSGPAPQHLGAAATSQPLAGFRDLAGSPPAGAATGGEVSLLPSGRHPERLPREASPSLEGYRSLDGAADANPAAAGLPGAFSGRLTRWMACSAALAALLAPIAWQPRAGLLGAAAGLALWRSEAGLIAAALAAVAALLGDPAPHERHVIGWLALPLLVPAALAPDRERWQPVLAALLLAFASRAVPGPAAAAAPVALAALCVRPRGAALAAQSVWSGALAGAAALAAAYPWMRDVPLPPVLALLGGAGQVAAAGAAAALALTGALGEWGAGVPRPGTLRGAALPRPALRGAGSTRLVSSQAAGGRRPWPWRAAGVPRLVSPRAGAALVAGVLFAAVAWRLPRAGTTLLATGESVQVAAGGPALEIEFPLQPVGSVVVGSILDNSTSLPPGTPVAVLRLGGGTGPEVAWTLMAGRQTGEWAARRADLAAGFVPPPSAWMCFVAGDFFGQRYRQVFPASHPGPFARLRIERAAGLPAEIGLIFQKLELRR